MIEKEFRADLHCHTNCSDGSMTPIELLRLAHSKGLRGISITDHDTIEAYKTAMPEGASLNIKIVSGVEFSSMHKDNSVHILAYSFSSDNRLIKEFCAKHQRRRTDRNKQILGLLAAHGMAINEEDIFSSEQEHVVGRPHIASAMVNKGYVGSLQEAFNKYLGEGRSCYHPGGYFTAEETIALIHQAKGLAIIAHPHLIDNREILDDLLNMNFDGVEGYYARFAFSRQEKWIQAGERKGWIITGGSDFHGSVKPASELGSSWVNEETFHILYDKFVSNEKMA